MSLYQSKAPRKVYLVFISMTNTLHWENPASWWKEGQSFWHTHISPVGTFLLHPLPQVRAFEPPSLSQCLQGPTREPREHRPSRWKGQAKNTVPGGTMPIITALPLCPHPPHILDWKPAPCGQNRGHILNLTSSEVACMEALQTQRPKVTTQDDLNIQIPN